MRTHEKKLKQKSENKPTPTQHAQVIFNVLTNVIIFRSTITCGFLLNLFVVMHTLTNKQKMRLKGFSFFFKKKTLSALASGERLGAALKKKKKTCKFFFVFQTILMQFNRSPRKKKINYTTKFKINRFLLIKKTFDTQIMISPTETYEMDFCCEMGEEKKKNLVSKKFLSF